MSSSGKRKLYDTSLKLLRLWFYIDSIWPVPKAYSDNKALCLNLIQEETGPCYLMNTQCTFVLHFQPTGQRVALAKYGKSTRHNDALTFIY